MRRTMIFAVIEKNDCYDWLAGYSEKEIEAAIIEWKIIEWCGTEEACARSINARLADTYANH